MKKSQRQQAIVTALQESTNAISATHFAKEYHVSRQTIVGDVALMRASGERIIATPLGYRLEEPIAGHFQGKIACKHSRAEAETELNLIVQNGGEVTDVVVEHEIYGQLTAPLEIRTEQDIKKFIQTIQSAQVHLLSDLADGVHLHTITCASADEFHKIKAALHDAHILFEA